MNTLLKILHESFSRYIKLMINVESQSQVDGDLMNENPRHVLLSAALH